MNTSTIPKFELVRREALDFLRNNSVAVVATSFENHPDVSPVYYISDDNFNIYFVTQMNTNKYVNISKNDRVTVVVGTGPEHVSIKIQGKGDFVLGETKTAIFERLLMLMYSEHIKKWPMRDMEKFKKSRITVFRVIPDKVVFMNLDDENYSGSISDRYFTLIP